MKVAIVNKFFFQNGGQETVALEQMKLLEQAGHEVAFFSMHHPRNPSGYPWSHYFVDYADFSLKAEQPGMLSKMVLASRFINNPQAAQRFGAFLDAFQPDIVHCHGIAHQLTYSILPEAKKRNIPIVQTLHDYQAICPSYTLLQGDGKICQDGCTTKNYLPCIQNQCVKGSSLASMLSAVEMSVNRGLFDYTRHINHFISPSQFLAQKMIDTGLPQKRIQTIPNFLVGIENLKPNYTNKGYYLYSGRLSGEKGLLTLLDAFRQVPQAYLHIAGEGNLKAKLEEYCQYHQLKNVTMLGYLSQDELQIQIREAQAVILPSEWYENQPMSIIEAFAHEKPVIGSNIGGISEMISEGVTGYLFPVRDSRALASIIERLHSDSNQLNDLGKRARAFALSNYSEKQHLLRLLELYHSVMETTSTLRSPTSLPELTKFAI